MNKSYPITALVNNPTETENDSRKVEEELPDHALVEEAQKKLTNIFCSHYQDALRNALLEAGQYIIDTFYDGQVELARKKKPTKEQSYSQLVDLLSSQREDAPKKSWLYNAVNLAVQEHDFAAFHALGNLKSTHKLLLLPVKDGELKKRLAQESVEKNYSSRELAKRIKEEKDNSKTIFSFLSNPAELFSEANQELYSHDNLKKMSPEKVESLKGKLEQQVTRTKELIEQQKQFVDKFEKLQSSLNWIEKEQAALDYLKE